MLDQHTQYVLTPTDQQVLIANLNHPVVDVLRKIVMHETQQLESVRNIDPNKNVGLQTVARQQALVHFEEVLRLIPFPKTPAKPIVLGKKGEEEKPGLSQWQ